MALRRVEVATCKSVGPRIGEESPRRILLYGHEGPHRPHDSWFREIKLVVVSPDEPDATSAPA